MVFDIRAWGALEFVRWHPELLVLPKVRTAIDTLIQWVTSTPEAFRTPNYEDLLEDLKPLLATLERRGNSGDPTCAAITASHSLLFGRTQTSEK
jgi:hypothetical protein